MLDDKILDSDIVRKHYDELSNDYDAYENTLLGKLYTELQWKRLLKLHLPEDKNANILDAGGGTGRITLPLAKSGYKVTLSDLSSGMLDVAKKKLHESAALERVTIQEANIASLPFDDETFDFVLCLHGPFTIGNSMEAAKELSRVLKRGGKIVVDAHSRYWATRNELSKDPRMALKLARSEFNHTYDIYGDWCRVFSPKELRVLFETNGIEHVETLGSFSELLPPDILEAQEWDDKFMTQVVDTMDCLSREPSVIGSAFVIRMIGLKK